MLKAFLLALLIGAAWPVWGQSVAAMVARATPISDAVPTVSATDTPDDKQDLAAATGAAKVDPANSKEDEEPPQTFQLEIDGSKGIPIELDQPFAAASIPVGKTAVLRVEAYRTFRYAGLSFRYPREYLFEADLTNAGIASWILTGNDCMLNIQRHEGRADPEALRNELLEHLMGAYKPGLSETAAVRLKLGTATVTGTRVQVQLWGEAIHQDVFAFRPGRDSVVVLIQDTLKDGKPSADCIRAKRLLTEALVLPAQ